MLQFGFVKSIHYCTEPGSDNPLDTLLTRIEIIFAGV